jgi:hypothetical protein
MRVLNPFAVEKNLARSHFHQAGDHLHGGGLAGAVGTQVAGDLAGAGGKLTPSMAAMPRNRLVILRNSSMAATPM